LVTIGDRLRRERVRAGLTQVELAGRVGIGRGHVWKVEHGAKQPSATLIDRWSHATGAAHADLVLDGPALFDLAFAVEESVPDPFAVRRVLELFPPAGRRQVAVWPGSGDAMLRLRVRGSALPRAVDLVGADVPGVGVLGSPTVLPVRAAADLVAWVRAKNEHDAMGQIESRLSSVAGRGRVTISALGRVFVAHVAGLSDRASVRIQDLVDGSPIGLFVPRIA
jgi:transcriptional regulator with XRE-family HTH domain